MMRLASPERASMPGRDRLAPPSDARAGQPLLLVDPDASSRGRMQRTLASNGFAVTCAATADATLAAAARFSHAVIELR